MQVRALSQERGERHPPLRYDSIIDLVGNTPIVRLRAITTDLPPDVEVWAKLEYMNPGGSVKDRPARQILQDALERGDLDDGKTLIDATSGNTGIAYAMLGAALQVPITLVMPENASSSRKRIVEAYGANIIYSSPLEGSDGAIRKVREIVADDEAGKYWYANQYWNPSNPAAHEKTTAAEIWEQTDGRVTHFVASTGTSGTVMGTGRGLKAHRSDIQVIGCQPSDSFHGLEGLKHMESSIEPGIYNEDELDQILWCDTEDGWDMAERLAHEEGLAAGNSSGANVWAALQVARTLESGVVVTIISDHADRYLGD
jgi:cysteine synthase B